MRLLFEAASGGGFTALDKTSELWRSLSCDAVNQLVVPTGTSSKIVLVEPNGFSRL